MSKTTIQIKKDTLNKLKHLKSHSRQSYDEVINVIVDESYGEVLSEKEINEIKNALDNVKKGKVKSIEKVAEELGVKL